MSEAPEWWSPEQYPYPHCNPEVLHSFGTCWACDLYPRRQEARRASNTPFTPAESNGWHGNVAQPSRQEVTPWKLTSLLKRPFGR